MAHVPGKVTTRGAGGSEYFQVGGYGCSINLPGNNPGSIGWRTSKQLAEDIFSLDIAQKTGVDLIFGVTPCGAAYLLVPRTPALEMGLFNRTRRIYVAEGFASLSPIHFSTIEQLKKRLTELEHNKSNSGKGRSLDRSKANKSFTQGNNEESILAHAGKERAHFEQQRLLVRVSREEPDIDYWNFAIRPQTWRHNLRVVSFAYNLWSSDTRGKSVRDNDLKILDIGWTEFNFANFTAQATTQIKLQENILFQNKNPTPFLYGETKVLPKDEVQKQLQVLFSAQDSAEASPILLLVPNKEALHVLQVLGVYSGSWHDGVEPVLGVPILEESMQFRQRSKTGGHSPRGSRDLSPPRRDHKEKDFKSRPRSPARSSKSPYSCYVVDVGEMYRLVIGQPCSRDNVYAMAAHLRLELNDGRAANTIATRWCAGNESRLLGAVWHKMATGNALEEQKIELGMSITESPDEGKKPLVPGTVGGEDEDEDRDPNDPPPSRPVPTTTTTKPRDPYESLEWDDDDDDF